MHSEEPSNATLIKILAPYLAATVVVSVVAIGALARWTSFANFSAPPVVMSFDVIKYTNAQRAVASTFLKPSADVSRANELLLKLPERTRQAITEVAGPRALVVLKQAVVQGQSADITDEVLTKLGLPTNVPTADGPAQALNYAPTMLSPFDSTPTTPRQIPDTGPAVLP